MKIFVRRCVAWLLTSAKPSKTSRKLFFVLKFSSGKPTYDSRFSYSCSFQNHGTFYPTLTAAISSPSLSAAPSANGSGDSPSTTCPNLDGEAECPQPNRTGEPWEASEGGIYLLRELSSVLPEKVPEFLPRLAELVSKAPTFFCESITILKRSACKCEPAFPPYHVLRNCRPRVRKTCPSFYPVYELASIESICKFYKSQLIDSPRFPSGLTNARTVGSVQEQVPEFLRSS